MRGGDAQAARAPGGKAREPERSAFLEDLLGFFPESRGIFSGLERVPGGTLPEPYRSLLVHKHHMTVTLEGFYGIPVDLDVRAVKQVGEDYGRRLVLRAGKAGPVVLAGLMKLRLPYTKNSVREEILAARTPLGRILIENRLLRRIQVDAYLKAELGRGLGDIFGAPSSVAHTYGRLAMIFVDEKPAVELLEIVAPVGEEG